MIVISIPSLLTVILINRLEAYYSCFSVTRDTSSMLQLARHHVPILVLLVLFHLLQEKVAFVMGEEHILIQRILTLPENVANMVALFNSLTPVLKM